MSIFTLSPSSLSRIETIFWLFEKAVIVTHFSKLFKPHPYPPTPIKPALKHA